MVRSLAYRTFQLRLSDAENGISADGTLPAAVTALGILVDVCGTKPCKFELTGCLDEGSMERWLFSGSNGAGGLHGGMKETLELCTRGLTTVTGKVLAHPSVSAITFCSITFRFTFLSL